VDLIRRNICACFLILLLSSETASPALAQSVTQQFEPGTSTARVPERAEAFAAAGNLRLHYVEAGSGKTVVLIHGNAGDLRDFDFGALDLLAHNYHVIAVDLPGHGLSKIAAGAKGTVQEQAVTLHRALSSLGIKDPILVGHSWGGAVALAYALLYPQETSALVLLAPAAYADHRHDSPAGFLLRTPLLSDVCLALFKPLLGSRFLKQGLKEAFSPDPVPHEYLKAVAAVWLERKHLKAFIKHDAMTNSSLQELSPRYQEIIARVIIVTGDSDLAVSPQHAFDLHQAIKNSRLVVIPRAGHEIPQKHPEVVLKAVNMATIDVSWTGAQASSLAYCAKTATETVVLQSISH
jgi:pimeloyl-ACP methyl ester carboxylesterase